MMNITNIHQCELNATPEQVGALLESLASKHDRLWPAHSWPSMRFDRPLEVGASGGHGPIGYVVEEIVPNRSITFRFTKPEGFDGIHRFEILPHTESSVLLRHTIEAQLRGLALLKWSLAIRPLHDALLEDCLATARASLGEEPQMTPWSARVWWLRWIMSGGKTPRQRTPRVR